MPQATAGATLPTGRAESSDFPAGAPTQEPAAQDNRLTFNPNDPEFEVAKEWEDGKQYRITALVTQASPGEFTVDAIESGEPATAPGGEMMDEGEMGEMGKDKGKYPNPAVQGLTEEEEGE